MIIMTEGLHALAGPAMRRALKTFTRSPYSGAATGAVCTAILQSSSATTVAAVGFVGAGLISFSGALGIIFGANIGTTITGWLVVLLGFKLKLGTLILPVIFLGAILKLFARKHLASLGLSMAGFGLIFVGITMMQQGMAGVENLLTPAQFPPDNFTGRLKLVALGILITVITQSSSAGVAAALTALYAGAVNFNQAAALVIGMDVGTTITALMATIGTSGGARRTGWAHVVYNLLTAIAALLLLTPYTWAWQYFAPGQLQVNGEIALVAFHTFFNGTGVLLVLPFSEHFARLMMKIVPDVSSPYTRQLETSLLSDPSIAVNAVFSSSQLQLIDLIIHIKRLLAQNLDASMSDLAALQTALAKTRSFVDRIHLEQTNQAEWSKLLAMIHFLDHLHRLHHRCDEEVFQVKSLVSLQQLANIRPDVLQHLESLVVHLQHERWHQAHQLARDLRLQLTEQLGPVRNKIMTDIALGKITVPRATEYMEALRWLQRITNHLARSVYHCREFSAQE
ncbi:Na/Pi cotransporter family protein [Thalassomonas actiniarum]|uniref:Na/Pi cotransporter family protein n=2 Tax=Thalassomonas actiniarum TaxID=485447 RepID=A0AAF0C5E0_9GAMM|nr:Na/Pi cotransporter family protein [Thalassomonas actiniarum]